MAAAGLPVLALAVLGAEVEIARRGENLPDVDRHDYADADDAARTAVWIGDSTAFGIGVDDGAEAVPSLVARERRERIVMLAVSGATLRDVVTDQLPLVAPKAPDRVYLSVGANDVTHLTRRDRFASDYERLLRGLPASADVVVLGVPDMGAPTRLLQPLRSIAGVRGRQLDAIARRAVVDADGPEVTYVDIAGPTGPAFRRDPDRHFAADGYHPSAAGYRLWADAVLATVEP